MTVKASASNPAAECSCCTFYNVLYFKEEDDARLESDFKNAAGETEADMKVAAEERAKNAEEAAKKAKYEERLKALVLLTQMRDRLRQEEEDRKREEARCNTRL